MYLESSQKVQNIKHVQAAVYFYGRAPSWMFDRTLNAILPNHLLEVEEDLKRSFPLLGLRKGISESPAF